jgi:hypothetical protein
MLEMNTQYSTPIALDESVATLDQLEACYQRGWRGIFVIKVAIAGSPKRLRQLCQEHEIDMVFFIRFLKVRSQTSSTPASNLNYPPKIVLSVLVSITGSTKMIKPGLSSYGRTIVHLKQRAGEDWLIGHDSNQFNHLTEQLFHQLAQLSKHGTPPKILIAEQNPLRFLAAFLAAVAAGCPVFLCNPNWVQQEWQEVFDLVQPDLIFGQEANPPLPLPPLSPSPPLSLQTNHDSYWGFLWQNPLCRPHLGNINGIGARISSVFWREAD